MLPDLISRRSFLKGLGLCTAGLAAAGFITPAAARQRTESRAAKQYDETRLLMGTLVRITTAGVSRTQAEQALGLAFAEMERLVAVFDRHHADTAISVLNTQQSLSDAPLELALLLKTAESYYRASDRSFDVTVQPVLELLKKHSNPQGALDLSKKDMADALALVDMQSVRVQGQRIKLARAGMGLTLDGMAKGYIVDQAAAVLRGQGVEHFLVNAGGDIFAGGEKRARTGWTVAVEDPSRQGNYPAVLTLTSGAIATSGGYEQYFDKSREHTHLLLPSTGKSPRKVLSVTVKAPTTMQADAFATTLSVMPHDKAMQLVNKTPDCSCLFIMKDGSRIASSGWTTV